MMFRTPALAFTGLIYRTQKLSAQRITQIFFFGLPRCRMGCAHAYLLHFCTTMHAMNMNPVHPSFRQCLNRSTSRVHSSHINSRRSPSRSPSFSSSPERLPDTVTYESTCSRRASGRISHKTISLDRGCALSLKAWRTPRAV